MAATLSENLKKYIDEGKPYAVVGTLQPDGRPHLTVVWIKRDGDDIVFSTTDTRQQGRNVLRDPRVTVLINPPEAPGTYAEIRGTATVTPDPERKLPDELSYKYTGQDYATYNPASKDETGRIVVRITPDRVAGRL